MEPVAVSMAEGAKALGVGRSTFYELARDGEIETIHIGRRRLATVASIKNAVDRRLSSNEEAKAA